MGKIASKSGSVWRASAVEWYGVAALVVLVTIGVRLALDPILGRHAPYLPFAIAIIVASRYGGRGPGLTATALSALGVEYFFLEPRHSFAIADLNAVAGLALFGMVGVIVSLLVGQLRASLLASRRAEEEVRRHAELLQFSFDAITVWRLDGGIESWNLGAERIYGIPEEEARGRIAHELLATVHPKPWEEIRAELCDKGWWEGELRHRARDGREIVVSSRHQLMRDADGILRVLETNRDVTEQKRAEEALRKSEERYRVLFDTLIEGFCIIEMVFDAGGRPVDYRFLEVNPAFEAQTGLKNARGRLMRELAPDNEARWAEIYGQVALTGQAARFVGEAKVLRRWYDVSAYRAGGPESRKVAILFNDITDRKRAEQEIRQLNAMLEQRVRDRTADLEAANKELEAFAYSVSHDLRAPLRGIDGWSMALLEDCGAQLDERGSQYVDRVRSEAQRLGRLIDDMLQLSRISRAEMTRDPVDLSELAGAIAVRLRETHPGRNLEFAVKTGLSAPGDARLLEAALANLLENAVKFTAPRALARIEFGEATLDGEHVFFVRDNGVGFDMTYAGNLFGAFQRMHKATEFPGTGIGLATVQRIIHRHGGRVWAEAEVDRGAAFYFTIPG